MMKTQKRHQRDRERGKIPKTAQQVLPIHAAHEDGIFLVGKQKYSQTWGFSDINYAIASREDQERFFLRFSDILNACDIGASRPSICCHLSVASWQVCLRPVVRIASVPERCVRQVQAKKATAYLERLAGRTACSAGAGGT